MKKGYKVNGARYKVTTRLWLTAFFISPQADADNHRIVRKGNKNYSRGVAENAEENTRR